MDTFNDGPDESQNSIVTPVYFQRSEDMVGPMVENNNNFNGISIRSSDFDDRKQVEGIRKPFIPKLNTAALQQQL